MSTRDPVTGRAIEDLEVGALRSGDHILVRIDGWQRPPEWDITIISVDPVVLHRPREVWVTGIHRDMWCRVLIRAKPPAREGGL